MKVSGNAILTFVCVVGLAQQSCAAEYICSGILTDQRAVGVSLGNCDLNSLSDADFKRVTDICGQPNGVGEDANKTNCKIRAIVVPKKNFPGIKTVTRLLGVVAGQR
jgi:hypothetical protein